MKKIVIFDLGTSSLKVSIPEESEFKKTEFSYPTYTENGKIKQYVKDWEEAFEKAIKWIKREIGWDNIEAISFTGQMEDIILKDEVILYSDTGGKDVVSEINDIFGKEKLFEILGNYIDPMMPLTKLYDMKKKGVVKSTRKILLGGKDYLIYLLTGKYVTDPTNASTTGFYNIKEKRWEEALLNIVNLKEENLPTIYPPSKIVGEVDKTIEDRFGIPKGIKIVNGMGDAGASALGMGVNIQNAAIYLGTTGWITTARKDLPKKGIPGIFTLDFIDGNYLFIGAPLNVGKVYEFLKEIFSEPDIKTYKTKNLPVFLPYLMGERSPFTDPYALSSWVGINADTKREDLVFSAMEGVCFSMYHTKEALFGEKEFSELLLTGGVTKNELWCRIFANVFGTNVKIPSISDSPSWGAYILGKRALGQDQEDVPSENRILKFDSSLYMFHKERYEIYKELYPLLKRVFRKLKRS